MLPTALQRSPAHWTAPQGALLVGGAAGATPAVVRYTPGACLPLSLKLPLRCTLCWHPVLQAMLFVGWDLEGQQGLNTMDRGWGSTWTKVRSLGGWGGWVPDGRPLPSGNLGHRAQGWQRLPCWCFVGGLCARLTMCDARACSGSCCVHLQPSALREAVHDPSVPSCLPADHRCMAVLRAVCLDPHSAPRPQEPLLLMYLYT